jgi:gluconolactonase
VIGGSKRILPTNVYRWDPGGHLDIVVTGNQVRDWNGVCFSPDYKTLHVIGIGKGPGNGGNKSVYAFDVAGSKTSGMRVLTDMKVDGVQCGPNGMHADVFGNLWISSAAAPGYADVLVFTPEGKLSGVFACGKSASTWRSADRSVTGC